MYSALRQFLYLVDALLETALCGLGMATRVT